MTGTASVKSVTVELSPDLHRLFKAKTALEGTTMQAAVSSFVEEYVAGVRGA